MCIGLSQNKDKKCQLHNRTCKLIIPCVSLLQSISQVVAGTNYFVKIHVGDEKCVHARIYVHFSGTTSLHGIQADKSHEDAVEYFD